MSRANKNTKKTGFLHELWSIVVTLVMAGIIYFVIQTFIGQSVTVKGQSMYPTLHEGDHVVLSKISPIDRFDVVIVNEASKGKNEWIIKRVIGLPGDTIELRNKQLYINGTLVEEPYTNKDENEEDRVNINDFTLATLASTNGVTTVPEGQYFVMGDNRAVSLDSRMLGFIDKKDIIGEGVLTYFPFDRFGLPQDYKYLYQK